MPEGVIAGGWSFVAAAYGITAVVLTLYVWSLARRLKRPASLPAVRSRMDRDDD